MGVQVKIRKLRFTISFKFGLFIAVVLIFTASVIGLFIVEQQKITLKTNLRKILNSYLPAYQSVVKGIVKRAIVDTKDSKKRQNAKRQALKKLYDYTISLKANPNFYKAELVENARGGRILASSGWKTLRPPRKKMLGLEPYRIVDKEFLKKYSSVDFFIQDLILPDESYFIKVRDDDQKTFQDKVAKIEVSNSLIRAENIKIERRNLILKYKKSNFIRILKNKKALSSKDKKRLVELLVQSKSIPYYQKNRLLVLLKSGRLLTSQKRNELIVLIEQGKLINLIKKGQLAPLITNDMYESYRPIYVNYFKRINQYDDSLSKAFFLFRSMKKKAFDFSGKQSRARLDDFKFIKELERIYKRVYKEDVKDGRLVKVSLTRLGKGLSKRKKFKFSKYELRLLKRYIKLLRKYKIPKIRLVRGLLKAPYYVEDPSRIFNKKFVKNSINIITKYYREKLTAKRKAIIKKAQDGGYFGEKLSDRDRFELYVATNYREIAAKFIDIITGVKDEKRAELFKELTRFSFIRPFQAGGDAIFAELKLFDSYFKRYLERGELLLPKRHKYLRLGKVYLPRRSVEDRQVFFRHLFRMVVLPYRFGTVRIVLSAQSIGKEVGTITNKTIDISTFLVLRLIFFAFIISGLMVRNIRKLAKGADQVGKGNLDTSIDISSSDELGQLADRFNLMVSEIKESQFQMIEKARMEEDLQTAHRIQESLLPSKFPEVDGFEFAGYYKAQTEAGGDYYDAIPPEMTGGDYFGLASADVSGHGVGAGLVMTMVRSVLRAQSIENEDPGHVLSLANPQIHGDTLPAMFATAVYFTINFKNYTMQYASAGHDPAILYNVETKNLRLLPAQGIPLGMSAKGTFNSIIETKKDKIKKGDILILYTDGITEAMNGEKEEYQEDRFCEAIKRFGHLPLNEMLEALVNDVKEFTNNLPQEDDISLLAMKVVK